MAEQLSLPLPAAGTVVIVRIEDLRQLFREELHQVAPLVSAPGPDVAASCVRSRQPEPRPAARGSADSWTASIERWLSDAPRCRLARVLAVDRLRLDAPSLDWTSTQEILQHALGMPPASQDRSAQMRVAGIMRKLGWDKVRRWDDRGEHRLYRWTRPIDDAPRASGVSLRRAASG